ncbi:hypothetical protein LOC67_23530 [Stieleria sp. JC731]|uniref:hypothetical protein n=1 Tax=Stieleria sp. JC731 TaxID=2894195 RepID=UPI001E2D79A4|nr:hypothetical protein [Stieleria sp. JC731]MCC9603532.1 hypothetical protein [Stieleria sp. JC731]
MVQPLIGMKGKTRSMYTHAESPDDAIGGLVDEDRIDPKTERVTACVKQAPEGEVELVEA